MIPPSLLHPPGGKPWLLFGVLGVSLAANILQAVGSSPEPAPVVSAVHILGHKGALSNEPVPPGEVPPLPEPVGTIAKIGVQRYSGVVASTMSAAFVGVEGTSAAALSSVVSRLFTWDVDFRRDLHRGDRVDVLFEGGSMTEPKVLAARLVMKPGTPDEHQYAAFRFHAPGDRFASYWTAAGDEIARRLIDGPLQDYEQISTLYAEHPERLGMDFKTPIGTPVLLPRAGKVTRLNWDPTVKGQSIEVKFSDGALARFSHLNTVGVHVGQSISAGTEIGTSGNTGRSAIAHLHYEVERAGKVVDPQVYHSTLQRHLQAEAMPRFLQFIQEQTAQLDGAVAQR